MIFIKRFFVFAHGCVLLPRFRDHHEHGLLQRATRHQEKFKDVVEIARIGTIRLYDREELGQFLANKKIGLHGALARIHKVDVAEEGVDLAVMAHKAIGLGSVP